MDISSVNSDIIRGNVTTIILSSLWSGDRYGYDILKEIETKSEGQYKLKQPTLYNQLKRLEKQGLISSYDGDPDDTGGGRRKYYSLTEEGRNYLQKEKREYEYSRTILDKLVSSREFDFNSSPPPFNTAELRPYTKREEGDGKEKVVYKDKVVEKVVEVEKVIEKKVYLDAYGNEISEEEAKRLSEEAAADAGISYFSAAPKKEQPSASLKDVFRALDEKEAEINKRIEEENALREAQNEKLRTAEAEADNARLSGNEASAQSEKIYAEADVENKRPSSALPHNGKDTFATAATLGKRDEAFEFEKEQVNYRDFFSSIVSMPEEKEIKTEKNQPISGDDLKTRLYSEGFKIRPYSKGNTSEYYSFNFIHSNRLNRDCFLIILALYLVEAAIMWLSLSTRISYKYFLPVICVGIVVCIIPTVVYFINPDKRIRANFNFKLSLLNRGMMFIELTVVAILIGFFALGASVNDIDLILQSVILPMVLLTNLPVSSLVHQLLYRSKRYHVA